MTNELLELDQEHVAEEEAREEETAGEEEPPKKIHSEGFSRSFCKTSGSSLKSLKRGPQY